jgi:hypothetical protein
MVRVLSRDSLRSTAAEPSEGGRVFWTRATVSITDGRFVDDGR